MQPHSSAMGLKAGKKWTAAADLQSAPPRSSRLLGTRQRVATLLLVCGGLSWAVTGCSFQQGYAGAQAWQRSQCLKITDAEERRRCLQTADQPYDTYKQQSETIKARP